MKEIEVGEYVRTEEGLIGKIVKLSKIKGIFYIQYYDNLPFKTDIEETKILKHSPNIIDLIEEGDYVNGKYVYSVGTIIGNLPIVNHTDGTFTPVNLIKSIVTKEQFKSVEYKLKE